MLADPLGALGHGLIKINLCVPVRIAFPVCDSARTAGIASMDRRESVYPLVECDRDCRGRKAARIGNQGMKQRRHAAAATKQ